MACVISLVADQDGYGLRGKKKRCSAIYIGNLTAGQEQGVWPAVSVDERVDFRGPPAPAFADGLFVFPPFSPEAQR